MPVAPIVQLALGPTLVQTELPGTNATARLDLVVGDDARDAESSDC